MAAELLGEDGAEALLQLARRLRCEPRHCWKWTLRGAAAVIGRRQRRLRLVGGEEAAALREAALRRRAAWMDAVDARQERRG